MSDYIAVCLTHLDRHRALLVRAFAFSEVSLDAGVFQSLLANLLFNRLDYEPRTLAQHLQRLIVANYQSRVECGSDATILMERLARSVSNQLQLVGNSPELPRLTKLLRIKTSFVKRQALTIRGALIPIAGGFRAEIFRKDPKRGVLTKRERFTLAHECGHTFFYYCDGGTPARIIPRRLGGPLAVAEENLCDVFARCLLQPI
jgi:hypothetical protein